MNPWEISTRPTLMPEAKLGELLGFWRVKKLMSIWDEERVIMDKKFPITTSFEYALWYQDSFSAPLMFAAVAAQLTTFAFNWKKLHPHEFAIFKEVCLQIQKCCCCGHHVNYITANSAVILRFDSSGTDYLALTSADYTVVCSPK